MFPHCFETLKDYRGWVGYAKIVGEPVHICEDCTNDYKLEMQLQERCKPSPKWWIGQKVTEVSE